MCKRLCGWQPYGADLWIEGVGVVAWRKEGCRVLHNGRAAWLAQGFNVQRRAAARLQPAVVLSFLVSRRQGGLQRCWTSACSACLVAPGPLPCHRAVLGWHLLLAACLYAVRPVAEGTIASAEAAPQGAAHVRTLAVKHARACRCRTTFSCAAAVLKPWPAGPTWQHLCAAAMHDCAHGHPSALTACTKAAWWKPDMRVCSPAHQSLLHFNKAPALRSRATYCAPAAACVHACVCRKAAGQLCRQHRSPDPSAEPADAAACEVGSPAGCIEPGAGRAAAARLGSIAPSAASRSGAGRCSLPPHHSATQA